MIKTLADPLDLLHGMVSGEGKVKDQELKSGASNLRKKASGAAKRAGLKQGSLVVTLTMRRAQAQLRPQPQPRPVWPWNLPAVGQRLSLPSYHHQLWQR